MPGTPVPYRWITGLPEVAQREIERDFLAVTQQLGAASPSEFDAIIDSALTTSDSSTHKYKSLTDLLAGESWTTTLTVGVIQRKGQTITETVGNSLSGKGDLVLFGLGSRNLSGTGAVVTWNWQTLAVPSGQQLIAHNLIFTPSATRTIISGAGFAYYGHCFFGPNVTGITDASVGTSAIAFDCTSDIASALSVTGGIGNSVQWEFYDCSLNGTLTIGGQGFLIMEGGQSGGITLSGANVSARVSTSLVGPVAVSCTAVGQVFIENTGGVGSNLSVSSTDVPVAIRGQFHNVSFTGTPTTRRAFDGAYDGSNFAFAGPGYCKVEKGAGTFKATFSGQGVHAIYKAQGGSNPMVNCTSLTDSTIYADLAPGLAGQQAYALDAASHNNLLILGGTHTANFTVASTDAGTNNRVITELDDSLTGSALFINILASRLPQSPPGEDGIDGDPGPPGPQGATGATGAAGAAGAAGAQGPQGAPGPPGEDGIDGDPGPVGPQGSIGATGSTGATGPIGATGPAVPIDAYEDLVTAIVAQQADFWLPQLPDVRDADSLVGRPISKATPAANSVYKFSGGLWTPVTTIAGFDSTAVHSGDTAGGDLGGTYPNPTVQQGEFGYVEVTAAQGSITTVVDLTSLTLTKTLVNGRKYLWILKTQIQSTVANDTMQVLLTDGTPTTLAIANANSSVITTNYPAVCFYVETGAGSSVTRKGRAQRSAGTGTLTMQASATNKAFLQVIDLGTV